MEVVAIGLSSLLNTNFVTDLEEPQALIGINRVTTNIGPRR